MTFFLRNEVRADIGHARKVKLTRADLAFAAGISLGTFAACAQCTTQWLASRLEYQAALGTPACDLRPILFPIYAPWRSFTWQQQLERAEHGGGELVDGWSTGLERSGMGAAGAGLLALASRYRSRSNRVRELHGSARWAECEDLEHAGLFADDGVVLGTWEDHAAGRLRILRDASSDHDLLFAYPGSGKGVGCVLPTCLSCRRSMIVIDLKGENYALTSGFRANVLGQNVFKLDLGANPGETARFNFLDFIRFGTPQEEADVQRIASARVDPTGALRRSHTDGSHWLKTGIGLLAAAILHTVYKHGLPADGACSVSFADVLAEIANPAKSHEKVLKDWLTFPHDASKRWTDHTGRKTHTHPIVSAVARVQLDRSEGERASVLSTVVTALEVFRDPLLQANTSVSDFSVADLMDADAPTTLYLTVKPSDLDRLAPVYNLFLDLAIRRLVEKMEFEAGEEKGTHKHKMLLVLDELPALGKLSILAESLAYFRGWGIKALVVVQSLMQLKELYGQYESISGLCAVAAAYAPAPSDVETAKTLSAMVGTTTVIRRTPADHAGGRAARVEQEISRPLMTPDEVLRMPKAKRVVDRDGATRVVEAGQMLVFASGCPAIRARQMLYFQDPLLLQRSQMPPPPPVPDAFRVRAVARPGGPTAAHRSETAIESDDQVGPDDEEDPVESAESCLDDEPY